MDYLLNYVHATINNGKCFVLNLIINGLPSKLKIPEEVQRCQY